MTAATPWQINYKWREEKTDANFLALREFSRCNVLDLLCLLVWYLLVCNKYEDCVICVTDDCKDMKKVKSKHEKDSGMDVMQTTCRPRPCGVSGKFNAVVPKSSKYEVVYTFVVDRPTCNLWVKAIKLRHWIDLGVREELNLKWDSDTNDNGIITKRLVPFIRADQSEKALPFAMTCFNTNCKVMVQGNHRDIWVENEFPVLKKIVIGLRDQVVDLSELYKEPAGSELEISVYDLVFSEDEAGAGEARNESVAAIEMLPVMNDNIEDCDVSDFE